jgi:hypothetical protein
MYDHQPVTGPVSTWLLFPISTSPTPRRLSCSDEINCGVIRLDPRVYHVQVLPYGIPETVHLLAPNPVPVPL